MQKYITKAVENFFSKTLGYDCLKHDKYSPKNVYVSEVSIQTEEKIETFYLYMSHNILLDVSKAMLFEENPDSETIVDLIGECANLIIGNAKILLEEDKNIDATLTTPLYKGYIEEEFSKEFSESFCYEINGESIMIAMNTTVLETV